MPHTRRREKELLSAVMERTLTLSEAAGFFAAKGRPPDVPSVAIGIRSLEAARLIALRPQGGGGAEWFSEEMLEDADGYKVHFVSFEGMERDFADLHKGRLSNEVAEVIEHLHNCALEWPDLVMVDGELEGAARAIERVRSFTHRFALLVLQREFGSAWELAASRLRSERTAADLEKKIESMERKWGDVESFDHVRVIEVLNGENRSNRPVEHDEWPDGTDEDVRRGLTEFELGTLVSPGGAQMYGFRMLLSLVEEEGMLRVRHYRFFSG